MGENNNKAERKVLPQFFLPFGPRKNTTHAYFSKNPISPIKFAKFAVKSIYIFQEMGPAILCGQGAHARLNLTEIKICDIIYNGGVYIIRLPQRSLSRFFLNIARYSFLHFSFGKMDQEFIIRVSK